MPPSIWIDVEDIFHYFRFNPHPSGIQRVALALARALRDQAGATRVRLTRHGAEAPALAETSWDELERLLATPPVVRAANEPGTEPEALDVDRRSRLQRAILRLPPELRDPLFRAGVLQSQVLRNVRRLAQQAQPEAARALRDVPAPTLSSGPQPRPGDLFLQLGAPWTVPAAADRLAALRAAGVRTGVLIHDLIPLRRPEWQPRPRVERFRAWVEASLPACDHLFTLSRFTAADVASYGAMRGLATPEPTRLPAGIGLKEAGHERAVGLPVAGSYALFVSILETRKNHALLVAVWHRLMAEVRAGRRTAESVPQLVFAGRVGLGVADLLQMLDNSRWLGGRVRLIREPSDVELRGLYEGCRFTLMPSLYEGWGLPVAESLASGKPCLAASSTALPEVGGALCRYFDPEDVKDAHRAVAAVLDDPAGLATWQAEVAARFRPSNWDEAARTLLAATAPVPA